jgi:monoamine oxidase
MVTAQASDDLDLIRTGLAPTPQSRRVIVVGAGMAGLVAAYELQRAGHDPLILEGRQRVGGRLYTLREPFTDGLYAELGGMRIPRSHGLTMAYIEKFGLRVTPFTMDNPNAYYHIGGRTLRIAEANANPGLLGFDTAAHEQGQTAGRLWEKALKRGRGGLGRHRRPI